MLPHQQCLHWRGTVLFHPAGGHEQSDSDQGGVVVGSHELLTARLDVSDVTQTELLLPRVVGEVTFSECVVVTISRNKSILAPPSPDLTNPLVPVIFSA